MKKIGLGVIVGLVLVVMLFVYGKYNPEGNSLFPKCPFFVLTDLKCPGCGTQRAIHCLLNGQWGNAVGYNALMVASIPLVAVMIFSNLFYRKFPRFYNAMNSLPLIYTVLAVVLLWWVFRNVFGW